MSFALQGWGFAPTADNPMRYDMGTNKDGPNGCANTNVRPSPTSKESTR